MKTRTAVSIPISVKLKLELSLFLGCSSYNNAIYIYFIKIEQHEPYLTGMNSGAAELLEIPAPLETPLHLHPRCKYYRNYAYAFVTLLTI
jgi:hypothetical protein